MIYGVDVSAYQPVFDFAAARREGYDFAIIKSTEGTGWRSGYYRNQISQARTAGMLVAAYHYVRGSDVAGQVANVRSMVDTSTPVIPDVEDGAGDIGSIRRFIDALRAAGYTVPLVYIPQWYWRDHMGRPDLKGLPPNWHSLYPDNTVRRKEGFVDLRDTGGPDLSPKFPSFGGIETLISQFTSSLAVANYPNGRIDGNAYRGTRDQLAALLGGDDDMSASEDIRNYFWNGKPESKSVKIGDALANVWSHSETIDARTARIEVALAALQQELSDDEVKILAAIRAMPTGGQIDVDALASQLKVSLGDAVADRLAQRLANKESA